MATVKQRGKTSCHCYSVHVKFIVLREPATVIRETSHYNPSTGDGKHFMIFVIDMWRSTYIPGNLQNPTQTKISSMCSKDNIFALFLRTLECILYRRIPLNMDAVKCNVLSVCNILMNGLYICVIYDYFSLYNGI